TMQNAEDFVDELEELIESAPHQVKTFFAQWNIHDIAELLNQLHLSEAASALRLLPAEVTLSLMNLPDLKRRGPILEDINHLDTAAAAAILEGIASDQRAAIARQITPHQQRRMLSALSPETRAQVESSLRYPEHSAGSLMSTEYVRLLPGVTVGQVLSYIRSVAREKDTIYACFIIEPETERLLGAVSLRDLVMAELDWPIEKVMRRKPVHVHVREDRESVARKISKYNLLAVSVLDEDGLMVGFITVDDVIDVMVEEQTEDILKMGAVGSEGLDTPYMKTGFFEMVRRRATWLVILFLSEMLTATAMGFFEDEIAKAVVLALFVPLIISSGGNSGSQATTIIIRALALGEMHLRDWLRVMFREIRSGLALGTILGVIGFLRIAVWSMFPSIYGPHWILVALTVGTSLVGIVLWGCVAGAMLPFLLKRVGLDPATSSAPFVATLVDVTGLIIYFSVAFLIMRGTLL
ncbi:MAG TPA: magnesium transporter, partial [Leptospiraceae bacterium]|nr:magnesium transporter [Leptospiraceae bacterium]